MYSLLLLFILIIIWRIFSLDLVNRNSTSNDLNLILVSAQMCNQLVCAYFTVVFIVAACSCFIYLF